MLTFHTDQGRFGEAVNFTEADTSFPARLVEKDYYCTVLLEYLSGLVSDLVFKGGTCLAKVHAGFFRLSEDLDFMVPVTPDTARTGRRKLILPVKNAFAGLPNALSCFRTVAELQGANNSTQYVGNLGYRSLVTGQEETIKVEVALREVLLTPPVTAKAHTVLVSPLTGQPVVGPVPLRCLSRLEAFAEKFRAALSRREAAVRDFYDIDYAVRRLDIRPADAELIGLIRRKLMIPGNAPVDVSGVRLEALRKQIEPQLQPVVRPGDFADFELDRAFRIVSDMAAKLAEPHDHRHQQRRPLRSAG